MSYEKHLIIDKRFWPTFWTQFFGAFNDNVFKNALVMLITYQAYKLGNLGPESMVALCGGVFILPFFLFSAIAGQICDKYPKNKLMVMIKIWEIIVMVIGAAGFIFENVPVLIGTLFFMGLQSTFFGPVKYSVLPELVDKEELVQGNALVEMGTFVAILLGTICGGILISYTDVGVYYISMAVISFAIVGTLFSLKVNKLDAGQSDLKISKNPFTSTVDILKITKKKKSVFLSVLGISWFWFLGAALLSMFPGFVKNYIGGNENVVTLFLSVFSIGVAVGSILCEKMSKERLELGLVPFGTIGISLFLFDLVFVNLPVVDTSSVLGISDLFKDSSYIRVLIDLFGLSIFSGFYTVPLYTFVQEKSNANERSRVIAGLNIWNALFMVISSVLLIVLYSFELDMLQIFGIFGILNLLVAIYIYSIIPEFLLRFIAVILTRLIYRLKVIDHDKIPREQGAILTSNHVSFADWLVIYAGVKRPVRFVMYYKFMKIPLVSFLFRDAKVIPIAGKKEDPQILAQAMDEIEKALNQGDLICIFPEGSITKDGELDGFRPGIEHILDKTPVPVIPMTLHGLWGSFLSRKYNGKAMSSYKTLLTRWFAKVELRIYDKWDASEVSAKKLEDFTRNKLDSDN